jgi:hypothetical protein
MSELVRPKSIPPQNRYQIGHVRAPGIEECLFRTSDPLRDELLGG